ncbi:unnamed protein product [Victoria cruziana]
MKQSVLVGRINVESAVCYIFEQLRYDKSKGIEGGFVPCILAGNDIHTCPILLALPRPNRVNGLCGGIFVQNSTTTDYDLKEHAWVFRQQASAPAADTIQQAAEAASPATSCSFRVPRHALALAAWPHVFTKTSNVPLIRVMVT